MRTMACNVKRAPPKNLNFSLSTSTSEKKPHDVDRRECVGVDVSFHVPVSASRKRISARSSARVCPLAIVSAQLTGSHGSPPAC